MRARDRAVSAEVAGAPGARVWRQSGRGRDDPNCRVPSSGAATQATPNDRRDPRGERAGAAAGPRMDPTPQPRSCSGRENEPSGLEKWRPLPAARKPLPLPILAIQPPLGHSAPQHSSVQSSWVGDGGPPHTTPAAMEPWRGRPHRIWSPVWSLHTNLWALMSRHFCTKGTQVTPLPTQPPTPSPYSSPQPPPGTGLLSRRWGGEMAVRAHGDT